MFKNHKFEIRFVKDRKNTSDISTSSEPVDYIKLAEESALRIGKQALIGAAAVAGIIVVSTVAIHAATNTLDNIQLTK